MVRVVVCLVLHYLLRPGMFCNVFGFSGLNYQPSFPGGLIRDCILKTFIRAPRVAFSQLSRNLIQMVLYLARDPRDPLPFHGKGRELLTPTLRLEVGANQAPRPHGGTVRVLGALWPPCANGSH